MELRLYQAEQIKRVLMNKSCLSLILLVTCLGAAVDSNGNAESKFMYRSIMAQEETIVFNVFEKKGLVIEKTDVGLVGKGQKKEVLFQVFSVGYMYIITAVGDQRIQDLNLKVYYLGPNVAFDQYRTGKGLLVQDTLPDCHPTVRLPVEGSIGPVDWKNKIRGYEIEHYSDATQCPLEYALHIPFAVDSMEKDEHLRRGQTCVEPGCYLIEVSVAKMAKGAFTGYYFLAIGSRGVGGPVDK